MMLAIAFFCHPIKNPNKYYSLIARVLILQISLIQEGDRLILVAVQLVLNPLGRWSALHTQVRADTTHGPSLVGNECSFVLLKPQFIVGGAAQRWVVWIR